MKQLYNLISNSILGGICISIACVVYLKVGGIIGAILFAFGLLAVVHYGFKLYTGVSGFIQTKKEFIELILILLFNIIGCILTALVMKYSQQHLITNAVEVVRTRLSLGLIPCGLMGIGCGFIMTTAVKFAKEDKYLPLLFGVPVFILCGFLHSIADAFYISMLPNEVIIKELKSILSVYGMIVLGNFIGCNLVRIIKISKYN